MKLLVYSKTTEKSIAGELGFPEYSYYFALKEFLPVLHDLGDVVTIENPDIEVDKIFMECGQQDCIFLSFAPPQKTPLNLQCPTIPVFAWEFSTIPDETWNDDPNNDWHYILDTLGMAITHSHYAAGAVKATMGSDFPVLPLPAPVWNKFEDYRARGSRQCSSYTISLNDQDNVVDSRTIDLENLDPLEISPPNSADYYDYAVDLISKRDAELAQRNADCAYAEAVVKERDAQLVKRNSDCLYAESIVRERDQQIEQLNREKWEIEKLVRKAQKLLGRLPSTGLGRLIVRLLRIKKTKNDTTP